MSHDFFKPDRRVGERRTSGRTSDRRKSDRHPLWTDTSAEELAQSSPSKPQNASERTGKKAFAGDVFWSLANDGFAVVASLITFILLGRILGNAGYGAYIGVFGITGPLSGLAWAGVGLAALQRILRDEQDASDVARRMLGQGLATAAVAAPVAIAIGMITIRSLSIMEVGGLVIAELLAVNMIMISAFVLQGLIGIPAASRLRLAVTGSRLLGVLLLAATGNLTILSLGMMHTFTLTILSVWVVHVHLPKMGIEVWPGRPERADAAVALSFSVPMIGSNLQLNGDKTVLNAYGMSAEAGVYGAAARVVTMAFTPVRALQAAAHNRLLPQGGVEPGGQIKRTVKFGALNLATILPICIVLFFGVGLFEPLLGEDFERSSYMARWLLLFLPLKALSNVPTAGLLGLGRTVTRAYVNLSAAAISMVLYIVLIPSYGWVGAVIGTIIGEAALLFLGMWRLVVWQRRADEAAAEAAASRPKQKATL